MAYDEGMADRVREAISTEGAVTEKRMFGGLAFLVEGSMAVAVSGSGGLMVRVDPARSESLVSEPHVQRMVMRGRAMDGWLLVDFAAVEADEALHGWVEVGVTRARSIASSRRPPAG